MKPEPWRPSLLLAAVVTFGALGLVFAVNEPLGTKWFQGSPYGALVLAQLTSWVVLQGLARVLDRSLDLVLDLVLLCLPRR